MDNLKHINSSGFPLQIGLANSIESSTELTWSVLYQEYGWSHKIKNESGFIDLVVENNPQTIVLNIECKRTQDTTWQFLLPKQNHEKRKKCKFWISDSLKKNDSYFGWIDFEIEPDSYESEFCVVAGQDSKSRPMLERIASTVVTSTEALAEEEAEILKKHDSPPMRAYFNVIATTAKLEVCKFDPKDVDLKKGTIESSEFEEVPYIRFRKQLSPLPKSPATIDWQNNFKGLANEKENTVLVVKASKLTDLLRDISLDNIGAFLKSHSQR